MNSRITLALLGSFGLAMASTAPAFAQQSCADLIAQLQNDWNVQQETAAIEPNTAVNPSETNEGGNSTNTATEQVYNQNMMTGNADLDAALSEAYAADISGDSAACEAAVDRARGLM